MTNLLTKTIQNSSGQKFKLGRRAPIARPHGLRLSNYVKWDSMQLPDTISYTDKAGPVLSQVMLNDKLGDCTAAGAFHIEGVLQANAGINNKFSNAQVEAFYSATTGYVPGKPETDQGGDENVVLNYWRDHGLYKNGHKIRDHATVDATNKTLVRAASYLFENLYFGVGLPDAWVSPMPDASGFTWDKAGDADSNNGHCFAGFGYTHDGVPICTWGMLGVITWSAIATYATFRNGGELHTVFSEDMIDKASQKAPNSFMADELYADMQKFMAA